MGEGLNQMYRMSLKYNALKWMQILTLLFTAACAQHIPGAPLPVPRDIFLPIVANRPDPPLPLTGSALPTPTAISALDPNASCFHNDKASEFYRMLTTDERQQRREMHCHPALVQAAYWRAESLALLSYWSHCEPGGLCANLVARKAGCQLPSDYNDHNQIESLVAGSPDMAVMFPILAASVDHARHLFGQNDFFRQQPDVGIAVLDAPGSLYGVYVVVMIAKCEGRGRG